MAREKDSAIELLSRAYLRTVSLLCEEGERATIEIDDLPKVITVSDLDAKFKIVALDQSSTPLSDSIKKSNLIQLAPQLIQLGVPSEKVKEEIIRLYDLPKTFLEAPPAPPQGAASLPQGQPGELPPEGDIGPAGELPAEQLSQMLMNRGGRA